MNENLKTQMSNTYKYLYVITYRREFKEICAMEMRHIFGETTSDTYHLSNHDFDISRSTFIKGKIKILHMNPSINEIEKKLIDDITTFQDYKIQYIKQDKVEYQDRLQTMRILGTAIEGDFAIKNPQVELAVTRVNGTWVFGHYEPNQHLWLERKQKPYNYSHSLEVKLAKTILNIAIDNDFTKTIVDPCCGIGTVLIEAKDMGLTIKGYEINRLVAHHANINLEHFGYPQLVTKKDMLTIEDTFDIAILDIPYGQFSSITYEEQMKLITKVKEISYKAVIISMNEITGDLERLGYQIIDSGKIEKSSAFSRHIYLCK